jgi:malate synthase
VTRELVRQIADEEVARIQREAGPAFDGGRFADARQLFEYVALTEPFVEFLTIPAYDHIA